MSKIVESSATPKKAAKQIRKRFKGYDTPSPKQLANAVKNKDKGRLLG